MKYFDYRERELAPFVSTVKVKNLNTDCLLHNFYKSHFDRSMRIHTCARPDVVKMYYEDGVSLISCKGCMFEDVHDYNIDIVEIAKGMPSEVK